MSLNLSHNNLMSLADHTFKKYASNVFVTHVGEAGITYQQAQQKVIQLQVMFKELGVKQGDKIAICSENMPHWGLVYLAITAMGAVVVPILPDFHNNEVHHIIKHSEAKAIFASNKKMETIDEEDFSSNLSYVFSLETLDLVEDKTPAHSEFFIKGAQTVAQIKNKVLDFAKQKNLLKISEIDDLLTINPNDLAAIVYTSGTTGQSKGVMLSHYNLMAQLHQANTLIEIKENDRFLSILPLAHTFECSVGFLVPFANGASIHYLNRIPSPKIILGAMQQVKPTCILSVPLVIEKIYKNKVLTQFNKNKTIKYLYDNVAFIRKKMNKIAGNKLIESFGGEIRFFGVGGAKLSSFVEDFLSEARFPYAIGYGLTETAPIIAGAIPGKTRVGTTGTFAAEIEYRFVKTNEQDRDGELHVRGPNIMQGYYKDQERTAEVLDAEGWLNTGDLGYVDEMGILTINGRSKNVIIGPNGENIYPECIEAVIEQHPLVADSMVYELDNKVVAKIHLDYDLFDQQYDLKNNSDAKLHQDILSSLEEIKVESNEQLSSFSKLTSVFEQTDPFIKTPTKKIKRYLHM
ncbi:long-chain fatty acid--CoA ligase [Psychromonas sp. RZ22]|uniref:AMP-binding protein n=1 Tax=Psychromonas algarum TaxID=2555643 RepID=UPI001067EB3E|nr:AMP-binding protein [Psychromonas sp. RZ22]TEW55952.1 long-chain fatty acid--CoA ligase [Psychromonas sp. RZ22]